MNKFKFNIVVIGALAVLVGVGCSSKTRPKAEHEQAKTWMPQEAPVESTDLELYVESFEPIEATSKIKSSSNLVSDLLNPLSRVILNKSFFENPGNRSMKLLEMTRAFSEGLYNANLKEKSNPRVQELNQSYLKMIFSGCSKDLRSDDCVNINFLRGDRYVTKNLLMQGIADDGELSLLLESAKTPEQCFENPRCAELIEYRYKLIAMAFLLKRNVNPDVDLVFAFLRFARPLASYLEHSKKNIGYLKVTLGQSFETMVAQYVPKDINDKDFKTFVNNFNPWYYSGRKSDEFRYGTRLMFGLASQCCFYEDSNKSAPNQAVIEAIQAIQTNKAGDEYGPSFYNVVLALKENGGEAFFKSSGLESDWAEISNINSKFYKDEMFYVVDRLFRGHIDATEAQMLIKGSRLDRANERLNKVIQVFVRVYLAHMMSETNKFMSDIYNTVSGSEVFREAIRNSRLITSRWHDIQSRFDLLNKFAGGYFKGRGPLSNEYKLTDKLIQSVNRNIHYLSVYPHMIVLTYYLVKLEGKVVFYTWWGAKREIDGNIILDAFFGGKMRDSWFSFGTDQIDMDRQMMLFAFNYAITSKTLETFVDKDQAANAQSSRARFFSMIVTKYLDGVDRALTDGIAEYQKKFEGRFDYTNAQQVCDYEMKPLGESATPEININFLYMGKYTYSGLGDQGVNGVAGAKLTAAANAIEKIVAVEEGKIPGTMNYKVPYVKAMIELIENDLLRSGAIKSKADSHPELDRARQFIAGIETKKAKLISLFTDKHKEWSDCLVRLQSVERMRQNRLLEEERKYLSDVYALIEKGSSNEILANEFKAYYQSKYGYEPRFDSVDGKIFRYSQYDLYMRFKTRIESDIFLKPSQDEKDAYGEEQLSTLIKPRIVKVIIPPGIEREDMVEDGNSVYPNGKSSREEFIKQAMLTMSGLGNLTFIDFAKQGKEDKFNFEYLKNLLRVYFLEGPSVVSPEQVTNAYLNAIEQSLMDSIDLKYATSLSTDGRKEIRFFEDLIIEKDSHKSFPLFRALMNDAFNFAGMTLEGSTEVGSSVDVATTLNNLGIFIFDPEPIVADSLTRAFGGPANRQFVRLYKLYDYLEQIQSNPETLKRVDQISKRAIYVQNNEVFYWNKDEGVFDNLAKDRLRVFLKDYLKKTGNLYKTTAAIEASKKVVNGPR